MALSATTARKAIERWDLEGGKVIPLSCGCRTWSAPGVLRRVITCKRHRV